MVALTIALALASGLLDLKIPEPTKLPSAPNCIIRAASAGVATPPAAKLTARHRADLLGGVTVVSGTAVERSAQKNQHKDVDLQAIPYCAWDNREGGEMAVWIAEH